MPTPSIVSVNPFRCRMWSLHDRSVDHVDEGNCKNEIESFQKHGQLVPSLPVAVLTGNPTVDYAVSALRPPGRDDPASDSTSGTARARHAPRVV